VPTLIIIAGPNGAGKTTFAREYVPDDGRPFEFVNADEIAGGLAALLRRVEELIEAGSDFVIETTLANLTYAQKIPDWRRRGYLVSLMYLRLDSVEDLIARVRKRVLAGGHGIPEDIIRRRFAKSRHYFETIYRPIVDEWSVWASREGPLTLVDSWDGRHEKRT